MSYTNTIIELIEHILVIIQIILYAYGLSYVINATHIAFQKEMALNRLYEWLELKFRNKPYYDFQDCIDKGRIDTLGIEQIYDSETKEHIGYLYNKVYKDLTIQYINIKGETKLKFFKWRTEVDKNSKILITSKYRNSEGLLYIAKPIYACASCMPSLWSLPLLTILVWWKVIFICIFASVLSTLIRDKLYND